MIRGLPDPSIIGVLSHLTSGWGEGAISELKLEYLYGPEPEVSGSDPVNVILSSPKILGV